MKSKIMKMFALFCSISICVLVFAGCGSSASVSSSDSSSDSSSASSSNTSAKVLSGKKYKIALNATFAPFESVSVDSSGKTGYVGFDIDVINAMAKDLGFTYTVDNMDFNGLVGALQSGRDDFVISGISPTEERKKSVDFTEPYFTCKTAIIERKGGKLVSTSDLKGKKIAASFGTEYETLAKESGAVVSSMNSSTLVMQELLNDRVDGAILDASQASVEVKQYSNLEYHVIPSKQLGDSVSNEFAIACPKDSPLVGTFNKELKKLNNDGTIKKLIIKWMGKAYLNEE